MSYGEKQKRYQSLVREAWEKYQQGDNSQMANLLEQSLEYTPYLRAETVSDLVTQWAQLTKENGCIFDADVLSSLPEWNKVLAKLTVTLLYRENFFQKNWSGGNSVDQLSLSPVSWIVRIVMET